MKKDERERLGSFFAERAAQLKAEQEVRDEEEARRTKSYTEGREVFRTVVIPALKDLSEQVSQYGEVQIKEDLDGFGAPAFGCAAV